MNNTQKTGNTQPIDQLKDLADDVKIALLCSNFQTDDGGSCRPMEVQKVCEQGNIWFFSDLKSDKNKEIEQDANVKLFFLHPGKNQYCVVNGQAEIITDKQKIEELWTPKAQKWFPDGTQDPNISIIKVKPTTAYYWHDDQHDKVNFLNTEGFDATKMHTTAGSIGNMVF